MKPGIISSINSSNFRGCARENHSSRYDQLFNDRFHTNCMVHRFDPATWETHVQIHHLVVAPPGGERNNWTRVHDYKLPTCKATQQEKNRLFSTKDNPISLEHVRSVHLRCRVDTWIYMLSHTHDDVIYSNLMYRLHWNFFRVFWVLQLVEFWPSHHCYIDHWLFNRASCDVGRCVTADVTSSRPVNKHYIT